jgi:ceramide glucosyltransferase
MPNDAAMVLVSFACLALCLHAASAVLAWRRLRARADRETSDMHWPPVTLIRPVCGLDAAERATIASTFALRGRDLEILFCVAEPADPVIPFLEGLIIQHPQVRARILIGDDGATANPKLNNLIKGWRAASHNWVAMIDSNVDLPSDYLEQLFCAWSPDTGLVSAPPIGGQPVGFWGEVECAFLNTYQARWQYAADALGFGFAQGKTLFWRRQDLSAWGGIEALGAELAEDAASTKLVRRAGARVRLAPAGSLQPLGARTFEQVWARQARWARLRRMSFPAFFVPEIITGWLPPAIALLIGAWLLGWAAPLLTMAFVVAWLGIEHVLAKAAGWHVSATSLVAALVRDLLLPGLWLGAWLSKVYEWRGNRVVAERSGHAHLEAGPSAVAARSI